jgi:hypothetical protein
MSLFEHRNLFFLPPPVYLNDFHELRISGIFKGFKLVMTHELLTLPVK